MTQAFLKARIQFSAAPLKQFSMRLSHCADVPITLILAWCAWAARKNHSIAPRQHCVCNGFLASVGLGVLIEVALGLNAFGFVFVCLLGICFGLAMTPSALQPREDNSIGVSQAPTMHCFNAGDCRPPIQSLNTGDCNRPMPRWCPSAAPAAASFEAVRRKCREVQARDIVRCFTPMACDQIVASRVSSLTKDCIRGVIPEAAVHAIPAGNAGALSGRGAQPEMDVVVTVAHEILAKRLREYYSRKTIGKRALKESVEHVGALRKRATKFLSEALTFACYWRSQLSSPECKVVLVLRNGTRICPYPMYINFYVNLPDPIRMCTLLSTSCLQRQHLTKVVIHWARQRCISNIQRGQFTQYAWGALVLYFCTHRCQDYEEIDSIVDIFEEFVSFFADLFQRHPQPSICFTGNVQMLADEGLLHPLYIEDPIEKGSNLAGRTTVDGLARVKQELQRALDIFRGIITADLFEKWEFRSC